MFIHFRIRICGNRSKSIATYLGECTLILYIPAMLGELQGPRLVTHIHLSSSKFQLWLQLSAHKYIYIYIYCMYIYIYCMYYFFIINIIITIIITIIILYTYVYSEINLYSFLVSEYFGLAEIRQTSTPHGPSRQALEA